MQSYIKSKGRMKRIGCGDEQEWENANYLRTNYVEHILRLIINKFHFNISVACCKTSTVYRVHYGTLHSYSWMFYSKIMSDILKSQHMFCVQIRRYTLQTDTRNRLAQSSWLSWATDYGLHELQLQTRAALNSPNDAKGEYLYESQRHTDHINFEPA